MSSPRGRHPQSSSLRDLALDPARFALHQAEYGCADLGLTPGILARLRAEPALVVLHNAWRVDFNHALGSIEAVHVRDVRNLVDLVVAAPAGRLIFVSSISSASDWPRPAGC